MKRVSKPLDLTEAVIAVCFLAGGLFGCIFAGRAGSDTLSASVSGFFDGFSIGHSPIYLFFTNVLTHLKYPLILFVFGFTVLGTVVIPAAVFIKGYALTFAFTALIRVLGTSGYPAILIMFGAQGVLLLPFLLLTAVTGLRIALILLRVNHLHYRTSHAMSCTPNYHGLLAALAVTLFAACICALVDTYVTPHLLSFFSLI